jgi:hypothetical protein
MAVPESAIESRTCSSSFDSNMSKKTRKPAGLHPAMTEIEFDNGYWYTTDLREFADKIGIPSAGKLRKDELEKAIKHFIRTKEVKHFARRAMTKEGPKDIDKGLHLDLPVVNYTSNRETKDFIEREAAMLEPNFKRKSGTRYLLNRWREEQLASGRPITYRDLVNQAIELNRTKNGPLRAEHGRYCNFISDFMANKRGSHSEAVAAWKALKKMDAPKTYEAWAKARKRSAKA